MRHYCKSLAFAGMLWVAGSLHAQEPVRPYDQWEATQFVAVTVRQPGLREVGQQLGNPV